jgi:hypothetical protein
MKLTGRLVASVLIVALLFPILVINGGYYRTPEYKNRYGDTINEDLWHQLNFLKQSIHEEAPEKMQEIYPEGYVFFNALYGLAWCDFLKDVDKKSKLFDEGFREIELASANVNSRKGSAPFSAPLPMPLGAYYTGWSTFLLGRKLSLVDSTERKELDVKLFQNNCRKIAEAIRVRSNPYLPSYPSAVWPADMMLCIAALRHHDQLFEPKYETEVADWLVNVKLKLDHHGLIPHSVDLVTGHAVETARGSSQSLILIFLLEIDSSFATQQFSIYKNQFVDQRFGLTGILEYPKGESGEGDIDSGPVIFGMGGAASIVGMRTLSTFGLTDESMALRQGIEAFAVPVKRDSTKSYLFGVLPMADVFIAWSHAGFRTESSSIPVPYMLHAPSLVASMLLLAVLGPIWGWPYRRNRQK